MAKHRWWDTRHRFLERPLYVKALGIKNLQWIANLAHGGSLVAMAANLRDRLLRGVGTGNQFIRGKRLEIRADLAAIERHLA